MRKRWTPVRAVSIQSVMVRLDPTEFAHRGDDLALQEMAKINVMARLGGAIARSGDNVSRATLTQNRLVEPGHDAGGVKKFLRAVAEPGIRTRQAFFPPYRRTRRSACSLCPAKFSIAQSREQYSPIIAVASGLTSWYVQVLRNLPTHSPPV